ncbi:hypothetical protein J6TS2_42480 [Heyndrickxia sporothermodurans]|nr:hypothetical protein J6TS2_42480 [Heyndrickxia sporothermodurans]
MTLDALLRIADLNTSRGWTSEAFITRATHGDANIKFTYGHAHTIFTPSFSKGTSWYSVLPSITVKVGYAANTLRWKTSIHSFSLCISSTKNNN